MTASSLSRAERRRLRRIRSSALDRLTEGDARFFARRADRRTRVRWAGQAEVDTPPGRIAAALSDLLPGTKVAIVVRMIEAGSMLTVMFPALKEADVDVSEADAAMIYGLLTARQVATADVLSRALLVEKAESGGNA